MTAQGALTIGELTAFIMYPRQLQGPVKSVMFFNDKLQSGMAALERLSDLMDTTPERGGETEDVPVGPVALDLVPEGAELEVLELHDVPLYNGDLDDDRNRPDGVVRLKDRIDRGDGLILVTPEYNYGVPGVLKNALDWVSRPAFRSPLTGSRSYDLGRRGSLARLQRPADITGR